MGLFGSNSVFLGDFLGKKRFLFENSQKCFDLLKDTIKYSRIPLWGSAIFLVFSYNNNEKYKWDFGD